MNYNIIKLIYHGLHLELKRRKSKHHKENILKMVEKLFRSIFSGKIYLPGLNKKEHFFYIGTKNQYQALFNIRKKVYASSFTYYHGYDVEIQDKVSKKFPFWISYFLGIIAYLLFGKAGIKISRKLTPRNPHLNYYYLGSLLIGQYFLCLLLLKIHRPQYVWLSNDHTPINVAFIYASKRLKIKSIYIQHASVTDLFPPLNFSYAFLDGKMAYHTYSKIGIMGTKVFLCGIAKMDGFINRFPHNLNVFNILVCLNQLDDISQFEILIDNLLSMGFKVKLRKHPYLLKKLKNEDRLELSKENVFMDSLADVDLLIAGDSNVHLEATLSNIPCFYLATSGHFDYYGFLKNELVVWGGRDMEECLKQIKNYTPKKEVYLRANPYCASVGTEFQNRSTTYILIKLGINGLEMDD
jgi:hypothetical protein